MDGAAYVQRRGLHGEPQSGFSLMSNAFEDFVKVAELHELQIMLSGCQARKDVSGAAIISGAIENYAGAQTERLANCGQLFKQTRQDSETGRTTHTFSGDPAAWMAPFMLGPMICKMETDTFTGKNSPDAKMCAARLSKEIAHG
jgi:hypothetical protein